MIGFPTYSKSRRRGVVPYPAFAGSVQRTAFGQSQILALQPAAWFRYGRGITVTGLGVSQWDDQSGNGRHLLQATDANRPPLQTDGTILFDGGTDFLKCNAFTLNQPTTIYGLLKQVTWTLSDIIWSGNAAGTAENQLGQRVASPQVAIFAGTTVANNSNLAVDTYRPVVAVYNGADSLLQIGRTAPIVANAGTQNAGGFTLGANPSGAGSANVQVLEIIVFPSAHDSALRAKIIDYLASVRPS